MKLSITRKNLKQTKKGLITLFFILGFDCKIRIEIRFSRDFNFVDYLLICDIVVFRDESAEAGRKPEKAGS